MALPILQRENSRSSSVCTAIYARVSTLNNGQDPTMQTRELKEYCELTMSNRATNWATRVGAMLLVSKTTIRLNRGSTFESLLELD